MGRTAGVIAVAFKAALLGVISLALVAAQEPPQSDSTPAEPDYPEPPPVVTERIIDGRFEPGNFEYLRGYFPEASEAEKAQYVQLTDWLKQCREEGRARLDAELAELGVTLEFDSYTNAQASLCSQVFPGEQFRGRFTSYNELRIATEEAQLVFSTLVETIRLVERRAGPVEPDFASELERRILGEQLLRLSSRWTRVPNDSPRLPQLSENAAGVFSTLTIGEGARVDRENTQWLKLEVAKRGWPKMSEVGEKASNAAWLLAQHADHDPAFQYRALRMMEPLAKQGEVSKGNYAYLYDRITLKLKGKQRFGSQITCVDGRHAPHALEEPDTLDELRAEMDLGPIAEYLELFTGECL